MAISEAKKAYNKRWREANPEKAKAWSVANKQRKADLSRKSRLKLEYGITPEQYQQMLSAQDGKCGICSNKPIETLSVDHDHVTGQIRGLLCGKCNKALGLLNDNEQGVQNALNYLKRGKN